MNFSEYTLQEKTIMQMHEDILVKDKADAEIVWRRKLL
jgi:hypothetical protein